MVESGVTNVYVGGMDMRTGATARKNRPEFQWCWMLSSSFVLGMMKVSISPKIVLHERYSPLASRGYPVARHEIMTWR
jgi:hypothetical protein